MMENFQDKKWACKWCNKVFLSLHALGGHMSVHRSSKAATLKRKMVFEDDEYTGHSGEGNPKRVKIEKFTGSETIAEVPQKICVVCGKGFWSVKAMHGHMRLHSRQERQEAKCKRNDKGIETLKETGEGFKNSQVLVGQFDGKEASIEVSTRIGSYATEFNQEEKEVAEILVTLSIGVRNWDSLAGAVGSKPGTSVSDTKKLLCVKQEGKCSEIRLPGRDVSKVRRKLCYKNESASTKMLCKKIAEYKCETCGKVFSCHKALGGHCSGHAKNNTHFRPSCN